MARTARQILNALNLDDRWGFTRARTATTTDLGITPVSTREVVTVLPPLRHNIDQRLNWSAWQRRHRATTQACHQPWNSITAAAAT
ncbi:hypothetical protein [Streptomyces sp. NPDC101455]|uniref:hypothetical protein n=1 Tax=Streptomyces sp. NPDC101455 TaxID=3366142 RepID=UPI0037F97172